MTDQQREMLRRRVLGVPATEAREETTEQAEDDLADVALASVAA